MFDKTAIISGGNGQVARALAEKISNLKYNIVLLVRRDADKAQSFISGLRGENLALLCDITSESDLKRALANFQSSYGQCDLLVNAAGINKKINNSDLSLIDTDLYDKIMDVNFKGPLMTIKTFIDCCKKSNDCLIVNISSTAAVGSRNNNLIYAAAKAAINSLTISLSRSLAPIRVISIAPGILENPTSGLVKPENFNEMMAKDIPLGRVGTGDDIADAVVSMINSKYITGQCITVDGGRTV